MLWQNDNLREELRDEYVALIDEVRRLAASTDPDAFNRRPAPGSWSAGECVDHLNSSARLYLEPLEQAIADARVQGLIGDRPDGRTLLGRVVAWSTEPPARLKMKTWDELEPSPEHDPGALADEFERLHRQLLEQLESAADLDGKRVKVRSLLDSRLKLSLDDWFAFLAAHGRRHLWQAERALEAAVDQSRDPTAETSTRNRSRDVATER